MSDIKLKHIENNKIKALLHNIIEYAHVQPENIKILTHSTFVKDYVSEHQFLKQIEIIDNLERAMDTLTGVKISNFVDEGKGIIKQDLIERTEIIEDKTIQLKFEAESLQAESDKLQVLGKQIAISIVDDDIVIQELITTVFNKPGWEVSCFSNGKEFINATQEKTFDLVFLDLLMPEMNGFEVLRSLKQHNNNTPVIVLSALSKRETVIKALNYGVRSYMIKPLKPERIIKKASEILTISY